MKKKFDGRLPVRLKTYTVYGFYEDNGGQRAGFLVKAKTPNAAEAQAIRDGKKNGGEFVPVVVLAGEHAACCTREFVFQKER